MEYYQKEKQLLLKELDSQIDGLSSSSAKKRQEKYGLNVFAETKKKNYFIIFLEQFKDFLVIILIAALIISAFLGDIESSIVIFAVITLNAILGTVQHVKAEHSLSSLKSMSAPTAKVLRDGAMEILPSSQITVGDIVLLEAGDYICADGRIIENASLKINESALTGESVSAEKQDTILSKQLPVGDRVNMVFMGSFVTYGRGHFVVTSIGMDTEMGKIALLLKNSKEKRTPLQISLDKFGQKLSIIILAICAVLFGINILQGNSTMDAFMFAVALAVAAIPEALSSIVTIVLSFGTQKMAKEHAIVRKLQAVEGLGSVSIICSDKTGTLTQNKMQVKKYYLNKNILDAVADDFKIPDAKRLLTYSILCNDASNENDTIIGDPTEIALIDLGDAKGYYSSKLRDAYPRVCEIPFDSERKLMSTVHTIDGQNVMITKGAVDVLLDRLNIDDKAKSEIESANRSLSENGLRVLAIAYKNNINNSITIEDENNFNFAGLIAMMDPPRVESAKAVEDCISAGIRPIMITGDHKITAAAIARQIGILTESYIAVEGAEIESLSDEELQDFVENVAVYARVSPEHKIRIVKAWQEKGNVVAMTGDGVNDAPALKQANIGVAMGITGTEVAKDAASMILTDDNFATIIKAVENGRNVYANIKRAIQFLLSGNAAAILVVLLASVLRLPVPFAAVHLLFINLLTDSLPAIALGLEPHSKAVMNVKPRKLNETFLTRGFLSRVGFEGLIISVTTFAAFYIGLRSGGGTDNAAVGSTMAFATLCLSRLVHGFNCKTKKPILFKKKFVDNSALIAAFFVGIFLLEAVLFIPGLSGIFKIANLSISEILIIHGLAVSNLLIIQLIKFLTYKRA